MRFTALLSALKLCVVGCGGGCMGACPNSSKKKSRYSRSFCANSCGSNHFFFKRNGPRMASLSAALATSFLPCVPRSSSLCTTAFGQQKAHSQGEARKLRGWEEPGGCYGEV
jgi:hypothetical protein